MACSAFTVTPKCPPPNSWFPSKCSSNITRSRGRISMSMANSDSNDLILPEQKIVTPEIYSERILDPFQARIQEKMQSGAYQMQSSTYQGERAHYRSGGSYRRRRRGKPPDIPSSLFDKGIVYIGMPLVPLVTELLVAEILYLQSVHPEKPIQLYINSTGTSRADGEAVALESEGFAIYDALMCGNNEIHTYCIGAAIGQACLLLAAGKKGRRYMQPRALVRLELSSLPGTGQIPAIDLEIKAKKQLEDRETAVNILAMHTGNSEESILKAIEYPRMMGPRQAIEYGLADKILWRGEGEDEKEALTLEEWDKKMGIEVMRPYAEEGDQVLNS